MEQTKIEFNKNHIKMTGYIYIRRHESYEFYNACKLGKTENIPERNSSYITGEIKRGYFEYVFEIFNNDVEYIEKRLQENFYEFHIKYDGGTEFYDKKIITLIEPYLKKYGFEYRKLSKAEIDQLVRCKRIDNNKYKWNIRNYQLTIINNSKTELLLHNKLFIELPTGGGKSYIVYNLFEYLKSEFIIIISPRQIVNFQNISKKYLQILTDAYDIFNFSTDTNFDDYLKLPNKKIIIGCTQSSKKIYEKILSNSISNITIWFDEAHWAIENWAYEYKNRSDYEFWLLNNTNIKYRIFTSASPNKDKILQNENIFGKLCSDIKVRELIDSKWLSNIKPYVYSENKENINNVRYLIDDFIERNRKFGFSFHNNQNSAFELFKNHYTYYKNNKTHIKPFLLISEYKTNLEINLDYNYKSIKIFESTQYSIGYVVAQYSMGYDFNKIDFIYFSEPKYSIKDIKQCIGRGIRSDGLGLYGSNKEKILIVSLPIYIDENGETKYETILEVLTYLLYDIEISIEDIDYKDRTKKNTIKKINCGSDNYNGINVLKSKILDLIKQKNEKMSFGTTYQMAKKIIADNNIKSKKEYYKLCERDNRLSKEPKVRYKEQFTNWINYLSIERIFYDLETCKDKVIEYLSLHPEIKNNYLNLSIICIELCKLDELFPPYDLWVDYYNIKDLSEIIKKPLNKDLVKF